MVPYWRKRQLKLIESRQARCISYATRELERIMYSAIDLIIKNWETTGKYHDPHLDDMHKVSEKFYEKAIRSAITSADDTKKMQGDKKRLAKLPWGLPKDLRSMEQLFRDKRLWPKIMKRSRKLTDRIREAYFKKLKKRFEKEIPRVLSGEISPQELKKELQSEWKSSKARVETIFRTETTNYFAKAQVAYFESDEDIIGFEFDCIRDIAATPICRARHGLIYRPNTELLKKNTPALHYNCRSHLIPLANTSENRKLLNDPSRNPKNRAVPPLPPGWRK